MHLSPSVRNSSGGGGRAVAAAEPVRCWFTFFPTFSAVAFKTRARRKHCWIIISTYTEDGNCRHNGFVKNLLKKENGRAYIQILLDDLYLNAQNSHKHLKIINLSQFYQVLGVLTPYVSMKTAFLVWFPIEERKFIYIYLTALCQFSHIDIYTARRN